MGRREIKWRFNSWIGSELILRASDASLAIWVPEIALEFDLGSLKIPKNPSD